MNPTTLRVSRTRLKAVLGTRYRPSSTNRFQQVPNLSHCQLFFTLNFIRLQIGSEIMLLPTPLILAAIQQYRKVWW